MVGTSQFSYYIWNSRGQVLYPPEFSYLIFSFPGILPQRLETFCLRNQGHLIKAAPLTCITAFTGKTCSSEPPGEGNE